MKYISYILLVLFGMFVLTACDDEKPSKYHEEIVVDGFMWVGQRMQISLTKVIPFDQAYYADSVRITGADVFVTVDGVSYPLTEAISGIEGTYAAADSAPLVTKSKAYDLLVAKDGDSLRAHTTSAAALELTDVFLFNVNTGEIRPDPDTLEYGGDYLQMNWTTDSANYAYAVLIEAMDQSKYGESCDFGNDNGPGSYLFAWASRDISGLLLPWITLCYEGPTRLRAFSCDTVWWNYLGSVQFGSTTNDPESNVIGGKGIFCAVGCDTFDVVVTDTIAD
ncbi:MAG: DUF4249 family protein [Calditrichaeota bacterium]|nr:DUF4249 family protein [Calditrichota bacterium]MCB9368875.1 DUF4249 family protein [Calditrichota bacterium]